MNREEEYFGEKLGSIPLQQLAMSDFHVECAKKEAIKLEGDNTGLRLYAGAHVAIRHAVSLSQLLENKTVIELGCGVGGMGLIGTLLSNYKRLLMTDGESKTVEGAQVNAELICSHCKCQDRLNKIQFATLSWGDESLAARVRDDFNAAQPFDVVLGCELMYFRTDVQALVKTVLNLTDSCGIFIHAHLFRRSGLEQELIAAFQHEGWCTLEAPHGSFISQEELRHHPEWYRVRALVSGPKELLQNWNQSDAFRGWVEFKEDPIEDELDPAANAESDLPLSLFT